MTSENLWKQVKNDLETIISPSLFNSWLVNTKAGELTQDTIEIICVSAMVQKNIKEKLQDFITIALKKRSGKNLKIKYKIENFIIPRPKSKIEETPLFKKTVVQQKPEQSGLSKKFSFENFLVGKNNQLAYAVASAVAEKPGENYNPVFLHSDVGLGKTHLLQAIGKYILHTKPDLKVQYTTGESFMNELIESIQSGKRGNYASDKFRDKYRKVDVLLVDDIQSLIGTGHTQEEFFHTFNTLILKDKQIVITSDRPPHEFGKLPARITSRFTSGMIVDIQKPDVEMRKAILRSKRDAQKDKVTNEVVDFIAQNMPTNIRELEGAYLQFITKVKSEGKEPTIEQAREILKSGLKEKGSKPVNSTQILKTICSYYSVKSIDIKGKKRTKNIVLPRQIIMFLMYEMTNTPYEAIGDFLGGRDHTTIMHGVKKIEEEISLGSPIHQQIEEVRNLLWTNVE